MVGHVAVVDVRLAAAVLDQLHRRIRRIARAFAAHTAPEVVDQDLGALFREFQRMGTADAPARPRDNRHLAVQKTHELPLRSVARSIHVPEVRTLYFLFIR